MELAGAAPQYFTYKSNTKVSIGDVGNLRFYPKSFENLSIEGDISYSMLYPPKDDGTMDSSKKIGLADILNHIPGIQIREFLPDTRLDQCINMFVDFFKNMTKLFTNSDEKKGTDGDKKPQESASETIEKFAKKLLAASWFTIKFMAGKTDPDFYSATDQPAGFNNLTAQPTSGSAEMYIMQFPYNLYYRLQSCTTTNIYEIPAATDDKSILHSGDGYAGWGGGDDVMTAGGFRISDILNKIPGVGTIANMILGNIGINYMPWWNPGTGANVSEPEIQVKFDLFNDDVTAAVTNFIFVNTIVPNNKWIQWNMFQHSSSLYDVKIEGLNRLFACAGNFDVSYEGVLRDPSREFIEKLCAHVNTKLFNAGELKENILKQRLIKIPDVYKVTAKFKSLLPANFNNWLYVYSKNSNIIDDYENVGYTANVMTDAINTGVNVYAKMVKKVWEDADDTIYDKKDGKYKDNTIMEDTVKEMKERKAEMEKG